MSRYLLAASPLSGHVLPMLHIGRDLLQRGHDVTMITGAEHLSRVKAAGLRAASLPPAASVASPQASRTRSQLPVLLRQYLVGCSELQSVFIAPLIHQYRVVRDQLAVQAYDAVLADVAFTGVVPLLLGSSPRPPIFVCGLGPLTLSSRDTAHFGMAWRPVQGMDYRRMTAIAHRVFFRDIQKQFDRALRLTGVDPSPVFVAEWARLADGLFQLTVPGFEYPRSDLPATVTFVGPVLPDTGLEFDRPCWWRDLNEAPIVVHVTQGTFDNTDLDQLIGPTLRGLAGREDVLVIASTAGGQSQSLRGPVPHNARVTDWVPYSSLMPHVDVMVTNGGYGGVQRALAHGVPLVVGGETSDKAEIAARVEHTGVGIDLGTGRPRPARS